MATSHKELAAQQELDDYRRDFEKHAATLGRRVANRVMDSIEDDVRRLRHQRLDEEIKQIRKSPDYVPEFPPSRLIP